MLASYTRYRRYAQFQSENPDTVFNGADLDGDYDRIKVVFDSVVAAIADVRRDDGGVKNVSIGVDQLKTEVLTLLDGVTPRGAWASLATYAIGDLVRQANVLYFALAGHTSGVFSTDLATGKWMAISAATSAVSVGNVPAGAIAATTVQDAINELDAEKQPIDATLTALAAVTVAANKLVYGTGVDTFATTDFTVAARTLLAAADAAAMLAVLGGLPKDGSVAMTGALVLPGAPTSAQHAATKQYVDTTASARSAAIRQTVMGGPVDGTTGLPSVLPPLSGSLNITSLNVPTTPIVVGAANGFGASGAVDRVGYSAANLTWTGLTASKAAATPNFLYVLVNADGTLTTGKTLLAPIYQFGGVPGTADGQFTFNISEMKGYFGNGSTAPQAYVVFIGEAATDGAGVISTVAYAYNGKYESAFTATLPSGGVEVSHVHNLGFHPGKADWFIQCTTTDIGYAVGERVSMNGQAQGDNGSAPRSNTLSCTPKVMHVVTPGNPWQLNTKTTGVLATLTFASWKYKAIAERGW